MDIGALVEQPEKTWVKFLDAEVLLEFIGVDELEKIIKNNMTYKYESSRGRSGRTESTNSKGVALELGERAVKDWRTITLKGKPVPFSPEKRDLFMTQWPEFARFVSDASTDIAVFAEQEREADEKNS